MRLALATCVNIPEHDEDERPLLDALCALGADAQVIEWDNPAPTHDPRAVDAVVLRSTWNYYRSPQRFRNWLERADRVTRLLNPLPSCQWNLHKRYLRELQDAGVPIVPTVWFGRGEAGDMGALMDERRWGRVVIKPAISAASFRTRSFDRARADEGSAFLASLTTAVGPEDMPVDAMVQPYLEGVETLGEHALMWIDGRWTHAIRKSPRLAGQEEHVSGALPIEPDMATPAAEALAALPPPIRSGLLYARADLMPTPAGWVLSELELLEPSLFLKRHPPALEHFARAIVSRLSGGASDSP